MKTNKEALIQAIKEVSDNSKITDLCIHIVHETEIPDDYILISSARLCKENIEFFGFVRRMPAEEFTARIEAGEECTSYYNNSEIICAWNIFNEIYHFSSVRQFFLLAENPCISIQYDKKIYTADSFKALCNLLSFIIIDSKFTMNEDLYSLTFFSAGINLKDLTNPHPNTFYLYEGPYVNVSRFENLPAEELLNRIQVIKFSGTRF